MTDLLESEPTDLEAIVAQLAADLRVTGLGQRTRSALRRNQDANDDTFIPYTTFKDLPGPDLVRHANAAYIASLASPQGRLHLGRADDQLLAVLQRQLAEVRRFTARLWEGSLAHVASAFADYDNLAIPFCPMYPNTRELLGGDLTLPHQLERILECLKETLHRTEVFRAALEQAAAVDADEAARLARAKESLLPELQARPSESIIQWNHRTVRLIDAARKEVPSVLLAVNGLINATVGSLVSLAVWDHSLSDAVLLSSAIWADDTDANRLELDANDDVFGFALPPFPCSYQLRADFQPAALAALEAAMQLRSHGQRGGIAILKGGSISWQRGSEIELTLHVVRLADYEKVSLDESST